MYNQYPQMCWLEGTRRWLPETDHNAVRQSFRELVADVGRRSGTTGVVDWRPVRGAFSLDLDDPLVSAFQSAYAEQAGTPLPVGAKPFVDDGNSFSSLAHLPAITHGPQAGGAHNDHLLVPDIHADLNFLGMIELGILVDTTRPVSIIEFY